MSNGKTVKLLLYDTAGNHRFKSASFNAAKRSNGLILMYDIGKRESFEDISYWIKEVRDWDESFPIVIIGNMCDNEFRRVISRNEGEELAKQYNYHFYESSNKLRINIDEPINDLIEQILKKREENKTK